MKKVTKRNYRKDRQEADKKIFADYEHNLRLHYEAKRKDLDIILSSSIPAQFSIIKTLIWINLVMFGLVATFFKPQIQQAFNCFQIFIYLLLCLILAGAILGIFALLIRNKPLYGSIYEQSLMYRVKDGNDAKSMALLTYIKYVSLASRYNLLLLRKRAKYMRIATITTAFSAIGILLLIIGLNFTKGGDENMADKPKKPNITVKPASGNNVQSSEKSKLTTRTTQTKKPKG